MLLEFLPNVPFSVAFFSIIAQSDWLQLVLTCLHGGWGTAKKNLFFFFFFFFFSVIYLDYF